MPFCLFQSHFIRSQHTSLPSLNGIIFSEAESQHCVKCKRYSCSFRLRVHNIFAQHAHLRDKIWIDLVRLWEMHTIYWFFRMGQHPVYPFSQTVHIQHRCTDVLSCIYCRLFQKEQDVCTLSWQEAWGPIPATAARCFARAGHVWASGPNGRSPRAFQTRTSRAKHLSITKWKMKATKWKETWCRIMPTTCNGSLKSDQCKLCNPSRSTVEIGNHAQTNMSFSKSQKVDTKPFAKQKVPYIIKSKSRPLNKACSLCPKDSCQSANR